MAIEAISIYFYLIKDALYIFNKVEDYSPEILQIVECVSLFRFWKGQTGSGLVSDRSLKPISRFKHLKKQQDLYDRLKISFEECLEMSVVPLRNEWKLREMVKVRMRDEKIKDILK